MNFEQQKEKEKVIKKRLAYATRIFGRELTAKEFAIVVVSVAKEWDKKYKREEKLTSGYTTQNGFMYRGRR